jgi:regulator of sirC expression with transglutaminase-like and TPR domain
VLQSEFEKSVSVTSAPVTPAFDELYELLGSGAEPPLDRAVALLSAAARPKVSVDAILDRLDEMGASIGPTDAWGVVAGMHERWDFRGDTADYHHPRNSYLDCVLDTERGLPISLSVIYIEIARRCGATVHPIGLPGHFVARPATGGPFVDWFHGGVPVDEDGAAALVGRAVEPEWVQPSTNRQVIWRMLTNLQHRFRDADDPTGLAWVTRLRCAVNDEEGELALVMQRFN